MFGFFKCKHPANMLVAEKEQTVEAFDEDFDHVTYHFTCRSCNAKVTNKHAKFRGGVAGFLSRKPKE